MVATKAIGIHTRCHKGLIAETAITAACTAKDAHTGLVPRAGQNGGLAFGTHGAKEEDGFVVSIGKPYGQHHVTYANV